jgi:hypothetical protein
VTTQLSPEAAEYREDLVYAYAIAAQLREAPIQELLSAIALAESVAPILYPSEFGAHGQRMAEDKRVLEILATAQRALARLPWPECGR